MKRVFVLNPRAGGGVLQRRLGELEDYFRRRTGAFDVLVCHGRDDTIQKTRAALQTGVEQVVAVGGDGTMNAVANGFFDDRDAAVRPEACLAVARIGTGSDYFRTIAAQGGAARGSAGARRKPDWREIVLTGNAQPVDAAVVRRLSRPDDRPVYFLNLLGFGLDARVVELKEQLPRWLPRSLCYLVPTLQSYLTVRPWQVTVELDGQPLEREALAVMVSKGQYAGGGMRFGGLVSLDDGDLEVTIFQPMSLFRMLLKTPKLYRGDFEGEPKIEKLRARRVVVRAASTLPAEADGELIGPGDAEVRVLPRAIRVCLAS